MLRILLLTDGFFYSPVLRILFYFLNFYEYYFYGPRWKQVVTTLMGYPSRRVLTIIVIVIIVCS